MSAQQPCLSGEDVGTEAPGGGRGRHAGSPRPPRHPPLGLGPPGRVFPIQTCSRGRKGLAYTVQISAPGAHVPDCPSRMSLARLSTLPPTKALRLKPQRPPLPSPPGPQGRGPLQSAPDPSPVVPCCRLDPQESPDSQGPAPEPPAAPPSPSPTPRVQRGRPPPRGGLGSSPPSRRLPPGGDAATSGCPGRRWRTRRAVPSTSGPAGTPFAWCCPRLASV